MILTASLLAVLLALLITGTRKKQVDVAALHPRAGYKAARSGIQNCFHKTKPKHISADDERLHCDRITSPRMHWANGNALRAPFIELKDMHIVFAMGDDCS